MIIRARLGQSSARLAVLDAYGDQCAVTTEQPSARIDAAHIRPFASGGLHEIPNGVPLRRDLHLPFDLGYVTIRPDLRVAVSRRPREEYANGRVYYELDGRAIQLPSDPGAQPDRELLAWHEAEVFKAR
ncbi:MAG: HNH endonuclease [Solirubrobacteraceae bacterium]